MTFSRRTRASVLLVTLVGSVAVSAAWANLIVAPVPPSQSIIEGGSTSVSFKVFNNNSTPGGSLILDYALAIINGPLGDDELDFTSVTFPTLIPNNTTGTFTYGLANPNGNVGDPDNGLSHISFYIEMSLANPNTAPNVFTAIGLGVFVFNLGPGGSQGLGPNPVTLTDLFGCYFTPGVFPNPCPALAGAPPLYTMSFQGIPFPAVASVTVLDTPEPASIALLGTALLGLAWAVRAKLRRRCP